MTIESIDIEKSLRRVEALLKAEKELSPALISAVEMILLVVKLLINKLGLNSKNSSKPPSSDPNREKKKNLNTGRKPGGQKGHEGATLTQDENPDEIKEIKMDRRTLPRGENFTPDGWESRQVVDIRISRYVTEYRAEILKNDLGKKITVPFPKGVDRFVQYGASVKADAVYMSMYQLIPYDRLREHFADQFEIPLSSGTLFSFNQEAAKKLEAFESLAKHKLAVSDLIHADETGININGKLHWLHNASNEDWTWLEPHVKRGKEAMDAIGVLPEFQGILVHDHWKPYFQYESLHSLCNAHHLRELTRAFEQDGMNWAKTMGSFLSDLNEEVEKLGGEFNEQEDRIWRLKYQ